ncbi:uncharacterized protein LOC127644311 [Xyrauchen texanus]|uniref:uncharacterized protein LOC127644311 n=1 Tax=Xyrauchen texanus TaxID=154827 RepID=UPI0022422B89|nr:uncharacterized protein LOC127644311 [Xyrauchen texanus]
MESVLSVKMYAVFALVLLASSVSDGRILSKCELKAQLEAALGASMPGNMTRSLFGNTSVSIAVSGYLPGNLTESMVGNTSLPVNMTESVPGNMTVNMSRNYTARIVCTVERISKFDTSLVTTIKKNKPAGKPQVQPPPKPNGYPSGRPNEKPDRRPGKPHMGRPGGRGKRSPGKFLAGLFGDKSGESSEEVSGPAGVTTKLFGIFQLSDLVACDSGSNPSLNVCRMKCSALTDDDIRDDIACLNTLLNTVNNVSEVLPVEECRSVNAMQYFAECA